MSTAVLPNIAPAPVSTLRAIPHWIGGKAVPGDSGRTANVYNPATGQVQALVPLANSAELNAAVAAAADAFPAWSAQPPLRRARVLFRFRELFEQHLDDFAAIITSEHGKVFSDARGEATRGLENIEFATGIPHLLKGELTEQVGANVDSYSMRQPLGVVAGITPFNFPAMVPHVDVPHRASPAATPSSSNPPSATRVPPTSSPKCCKEAGLPDGVFNIVHGDKQAVDAILTHPTASLP